jgi:hypothetical protein
VWEKEVKVRDFKEEFKDKQQVFYIFFKSL